MEQTAKILRSTGLVRPMPWDLVSMIRGKAWHVEDVVREIANGADHSWELSLGQAVLVSVAFFVDTVDADLIATMSIGETYTGGENEATKYNLSEYATGDATFSIYHDPSNYAGDVEMSRILPTTEEEVLALESLERGYMLLQAGGQRRFKVANDSGDTRTVKLLMRVHEID